MSRANVAKSRADKAGKTTSAPTPAVTHEIVPGKCNDQDWNLMLDHDDGDDFMLDIVEEVVESAMSIVYKNYLDRQLIPYTVTQAKDALLQIIEWQFLSCDNGEVNLEEDEGWQEDEEPEPAMTDCWAQGSVPKQILPPTPRSEELEQVQEEEEEEVLRTPTPISEEQEEETISSSQREEESSTTTEGSEEMTEQPKLPQKPKDPRRRNVKFRPYRGKLKSAGVGGMVETLAETEMRQWFEDMTPVPPKTPDTVVLQMPNSCQSIIKNGYDDIYSSSSPTMGAYTSTSPANVGWFAKLQTGRPPGIRDVVYDDTGNVVAVTKITPGRLPTHRVRTGFQVVDPAVEAAQARLEAMRTGRQKRTVQNKTKKTSPRVVTITPANRNTSALKVPAGPQPLGRVREGITPLPPPLVEVMEVAPGVVVKEGDRVRHGPKQHPQRAEMIAHAANRALHPVRATAALPTVLVAELIGHGTPLIKPLGEARPIPPIAPHPPYQAV